MMSNYRWIAWSRERGWCGHRHASEEIAQRCADADGRQVCRVDAGAAKRDQREIDRVRQGGALAGRLYYER